MFWGSEYANFYVFENDNIVSMQTKQMQICKTSDVMLMHIMFSVYRYARRSVIFLYKVASPPTGRAAR